MSAIKNLVEKNSFVKAWVYFFLGEVFSKNSFREKYIRITSRSLVWRKINLFFIKNFRKNEKIQDYPATIDFDVKQHLDNVFKNGFSAGITIPNSLLKELIAFSNEAKYRINMNPDNLMQIQFDSPETTREEGNHFNCLNAHLYNEACKKVAYDKNVLSVVRGYFGMEPVVSSSALLWSYPIHANGKCLGDNEWGFHYDLDDYKFLKIFIYLNDVDMQTGPHVLVEKTHIRKSFFEKLHRRMTDEEVKERFPEQIRIIQGKAGSAFFTDTYNIHKGLEPKKKRCIYQVTYSVTDIQKNKKK
ncbi:MAG: hypothetical protein ACKOXB_06095 [Flavobacteriales bacterium]